MRYISANTDVLHIFCFWEYRVLDTLVMFIKVNNTLNCNCVADNLPPVSFNSLWPSEDKCQYSSGSKSVQIMACCLTAPSHCLNQCWPLISEVLSHSLDATSQRMQRPLFCRINFMFYLKNYCQGLPGARELIWIKMQWICSNELSWKHNGSAA